METSALKKFTQAAFIVSVAGAVVMIANYYGLNLFYSIFGKKATVTFLTALSFAFTVIIIFSFVLGVLLIINLPKFSKSILTGVLLVISAVLGWFYPVPLLIVIWIVTAVLLFRLKFDEENSSAI